MKKGWVICVEDKAASDQAFKLEFKTKPAIREKTKSLQERYNAIEAERFSVIGNIPYSEISVDTRKVITLYLNSVPLEEVMAVLAIVNPMVVSETENSFMVEVDSASLERVQLVIDKHSEITTSLSL